MADETVVPIDDNAVKHYRRKGSLMNNSFQRNEGICIAGANKHRKDPGVSEETVR